MPITDFHAKLGAHRLVNSRGVAGQTHTLTSYYNLSSVMIFVCPLTTRTFMDGHQTWQGGRCQARKTPRENEILLFLTITLVDHMNA